MIFSNEVFILLLFVVLILIIVVVVVLIKVYVSNKQRKVISNELEINYKSGEKIDNSMIDSKYISGIYEIIINNAQGQQLALQPSDTKALENKKFREITSGGLSISSHMVQGAMPILAQAHTISEINQLAQNGLFTATAPISELMKYTNGTYGSPVIGKGHVVRHAGFEKLDNPSTAVLLSPAAVVGAGMQAMAAISGQYYMHQISRQLSSIENKLDILVSYHHDEKIAMLLTIKESLKRITTKQYCDISDIFEIRNLSKDARNVFNEYNLRLQRMDINDIINVKARKLNTQKSFKELSDSIDKHELELSIKVCYYADFLSYQCELAEIAARMKYNKNDDLVINEKMEQLETSYKGAFFMRVEKEIDRIFVPINKQAEKIIDESIFSIKSDKFSVGDERSEFGRITNKSIKLKEEISGEEHTSFINIMHSIEEPKTILYLPSDNPEEQRMFVSEDNFLS